MRIFTTPKNFKKGKLIANQFRWIDIIILAGGTLISVAGILICFSVFEGRSWLLLLVLLIPIASGFVLTLPLGIYHNVLEYLRMVFESRGKQKEYTWEGIYRYDSFEEKEID